MSKRNALANLDAYIAPIRSCDTNDPEQQCVLIISCLLFIFAVALGYYLFQNKKPISSSPPLPSNVQAPVVLPGLFVVRLTY